MKKIKKYIVAAAILAAAYFVRVPVQMFRMQNTAGYQAAEIVRVVDGDTLVVKLDGDSVRVRLIGVDCEETTLEDERLNTDKGRAEAAFVKELLPEGCVVYLQKDESETDVYGRLLRYVWLEIPENPWDIEEVRTGMLNGILIEKMHTQVKDYPPDVLYSELFWEINQAGS